MGFLTDFLRNSFRMSDRELDILSFIVSRVEDGLPFPVKPTRLINELDMCWAPEMVFSEDYTYGMWTYMHPRSVFIRPEGNEDMARRIRQHARSLSHRDIGLLAEMERTPCHTAMLFRNIPGVDHALLSFAVNMLEAEGHTTCTILHELWHRQQFVSRPLWYFVSCLATNLVNYEWACTQPWSIECDVREKVDNDWLRASLKGIYTPFYDYIYELNRYHSGKLKDEAMENLKGYLEKLGEDKTVRVLMNLVKLK